LHHGMCLYYCVAFVSYAYLIKHMYIESVRTFKDLRPYAPHRCASFVKLHKIVSFGLPVSAERLRRVISADVERKIARITMSIQSLVLNIQYPDTFISYV
jgi:hypothetical protein